MEDNKETRGDLMTKIVDAFDKFTGIFSKHGKFWVICLMFLFLIFYAFILNPININHVVEKLLEQRQTDREFIEDKGFQKRLQADRVLMPILNDIVEDNDSIQRAIIFEMHNGTISKGRVDLLYLSATFETIDSDNIELDLIGDYFQKQPLNSLFANGLDNIMYKKYMYFSDLTKTREGTSRFAKKFYKLGVNSVMLIPIKDENDVPLIILVLASEYQFNAEQEYQKIAPLIANLKNILMNNE